MRPFGRRDFLKAASAGVTALTVPQLLIPNWAKSQTPEMLDDAMPYDKVQLREVSQKALDSARAAGAQFADVRIIVGKQMTFGMSSQEGAGRLTIRNSASIGVRAVVASSMGFAGDVLQLDDDKTASLAHLAVARAKAGRLRKVHAFEFAAAPAIHGSWQTPIDVDPFAVPIGEQQALGLAAIADLMKRKMSSDLECGCVFTWVRRDEIFASIEGSLIEQRTYTAQPSVLVRLPSRHAKDFWIQQNVKSVLSGGHGYESVSKTNLAAELVRAAEDAVRLSTQAVKPAEVGRYDLVFSTGATSAILGNTIGNPLELDRGLMLAANTKGPTYAAPPLAILGKFHVASELVNITADRSRPGSNATVGWDAEGVKPEDFALVEKGVIVDYVTNRQTAPALRTWYEKRGTPLRSHGCASNSGMYEPTLHLPNLTLQPGTTDSSVGDLIKDLKHGYLIEGLGVSTDQAGLNTQAVVTIAEEIVDGRRVGLTNNMAIQFSTPQFWKSVVAIGGPRSAVTEGFFINQLVVEQLGFVGISAVPIRVRGVNVISAGQGA